MAVAVGGRHQLRPPATISSNAAMLPDELSPVTRKWTLTCPSWMIPSEGIDAVLGFCCAISFLLHGGSIHPTNSRPYRGAASSILCRWYWGSSAGGNVMAGAGTLNSLNHPSSLAGVSSWSIRSCSDSIVNEWRTPRRKKIIVPGVTLIVRSSTVTTISPLQYVKDFIFPKARSDRCRSDGTRPPACPREASCWRPGKADH